MPAFVVMKCAIVETFFQLKPPIFNSFRGVGVALKTWCEEIEVATPHFKSLCTLHILTLQFLIKQVIYLYPYLQT